MRAGGRRLTPQALSAAAASHVVTGRAPADASSKIMGSVATARGERSSRDHEAAPILGAAAAPVGLTRVACALGTGQAGAAECLRHRAATIRPTPTASTPVPTRTITTARTPATTRTPATEIGRAACRE